MEGKTDIETGLKGQQIKRNWGFVGSERTGFLGKVIWDEGYPIQGQEVEVESVDFSTFFVKHEYQRRD